MGHGTSGFVLIGMRRSGKTTTGTVLAAHLGRIFIDTDRVVRARHRRTPGAIIAADGEARFRELEAAAVIEAVQHQGAIIATGGGAVLRPESCERLRAHGGVIYLHVDPDELLARAACDLRPEARPPLVGTGGDDEVRTLYAQRDPIYRRVAHHVVEAVDPVAMVVERCLDVADLDSAGGGGPLSSRPAGGAEPGPV